MGGPCAAAQPPFISPIPSAPPPEPATGGVFDGEDDGGEAIFFPRCLLVALSLVFAAGVQWMVLASSGHHQLFRRGSGRFWLAPARIFVSLAGLA